MRDLAFAVLLDLVFCCGHMCETEVEISITNVFRY